MDILLASSSPYRAELLRRLGLAFRQQAPQVDESRLPKEPPRDYVCRLARSKAATLAADGCLSIGSDQVAVLRDTILGKPGHRDAALEQLQALSGQRATFLTGVCVIGPHGQVQLACVTTEVCFRTLERPQLETYLQREDALQCAAALRSEGLGITLVESIQGDDPSALIGLPLIQLTTMLQQAGCHPPTPTAHPP